MVVLPGVQRASERGQPVARQELARNVRIKGLHKNFEAVLLKYCGHEGKEAQPYVNAEVLELFPSVPDIGEMKFIDAKLSTEVSNDAGHLSEHRCIVCGRHNDGGPGLAPRVEGSVSHLEPRRTRVVDEDAIVLAPG